MTTATAPNPMTTCALCGRENLTVTLTIRIARRFFTYCNGAAAEVDLNVSEDDPAHARAVTACRAGDMRTLSAIAEEFCG